MIRAAELDARLASYRDDVMTRTWRAFGVIAFLALVNNVVAITGSGLSVPLVINVLVATAVLGVNAFLKTIPYIVKVAVALLLMLLLGFGNFIEAGMFGAGWYWFVLVSLLAAVLYSIRLGVLAMGLFAVVMLVVGYGHVSGVIKPAIDMNIAEADLGFWINSFIVVILASSVLLYAISGYIKAIQELLVEVLAQRERSDALARREMQLVEAQLAQSEKMASLGVLIAGVTHEINTPIGAIKSSGASITDALDQALTNLTPLFEALDTDKLALFLQLIQQAHATMSPLGTREARAATAEATRMLETAGIDAARIKAGLLVKLNAQSRVQDYLPLLRHPESELILDTAGSLAAIIRSTGNINVAVERVAKLVLALKSFSRVNRSAEMTEASLQDGIETVLTIYHHQLKHEVEVVRNYEDIPPIRCLPDELNQVWTNLIHNALQAMEHKGALTVGIRRVGDEAVVSVGDTGCGIPEEIRGKIFDVFFTTKPAGVGSGLGLDIVRKIIDKHRGRIEVASKVGVGTTFSVHLPYGVELQ